jgi:hypothetical protein
MAFRVLPLEALRCIKMMHIASLSGELPGQVKQTIRVLLRGDVNSRTRLLRTGPKLMPGSDRRGSPSKQKYRKQPHAKTGTAGMDAFPAKNILTRRANQRHKYMLTQFL